MTRQMHLEIQQLAERLLAMHPGMTRLEAEDLARDIIIEKTT